MPDTISRDSDALICALYGEYLTRRKHAIPIERAAYFDSAERIRENFAPNWLLEDVVTVCGWLNSHEFISVLFADDSVYDVRLTEYGIIYMEQRFEQKVEKVTEWLANLAQILLTPLK